MASARSEVFQAFLEFAELPIRPRQLIQDRQQRGRLDAAPHRHGIAGFFQERPRRLELAPPIMLRSQFRKRLGGFRTGKRLAVDTSVGAQHFAPMGDASQSAAGNKLPAHEEASVLVGGAVFLQHRGHIVQLRGIDRPLQDDIEHAVRQRRLGENNHHAVQPDAVEPGKTRRLARRLGVGTAADLRAPLRARAGLAAAPSIRRDPLQAGDRNATRGWRPAP